MRVLGIDPGTVTLDICGLDNGTVIVDRSMPTIDALRNPQMLARLIQEAAPLDLVAGPSGYGLPLIPAREASDDDLRLACLAPEGSVGGIGGLRALMRALGRLDVPVVFTPGVVHLPSVPAHRKVNRVDMGTADKLCAVVLALRQETARLQRGPEDVSFVLLELGGAFTAAIAVDGGRVVDGVGGTSGPLGARGSGALDGEVAFLMRTVEKDALFLGGAATVAGAEGTAWPAGTTTPRSQRAWNAYIEQAAKAVAALWVAAPRALQVLLSGRHATLTARDALMAALGPLRAGVDVRVLDGVAAVSKHAAQGAALMADGLAGGAMTSIVERLGIREAEGTVLDHLSVMTPDAARRRLGMG
jgi:predicted butyrate kinase (DUF1464 family)